MSARSVNLWAVLATVTLGFFMTLLDLTIVNIAIPSIIDKLNASLYQVLWIVNAYTLVLASLLITSGRLGDVIGQRNAFIAGVAVFTLASVSCGLAPTPAWLIAFRAAQGLGAALLMPQTLAILTVVFPADRRGMAFGVWGGVAGLATVAGPTVGGLLVTSLGWRYIFFVNLPIGMLVVVLGMIFIPDLRSGVTHRFDLEGVALGSVGLFALCYGLIEGQRYNWGKIASVVSIPLILAAALILLVVFFWLESRPSGRESLIPWKALSTRNFSLMNIISACAPVGIIGILLPFTIYLQSVLGFSALKAGLVMAPASAVSMLIAPIAGRLSDAIGGKYILFGGLLFFAGGIALVAASARSVSGPWTFLPGLALAGVGIGCTFAPMIAVAMSEIDPSMAGAASGVFNTSRQVGTVIGTAGIGALLANRLTAAWTAAAGRLAATVPGSARRAILDRFSSAATGGLDLTRAVGNSKLIQHVYVSGFVTAMRPTMIAGACVLLLSSVIALGITAKRAAGPKPELAALSESASSSE